MLFQEDVTWKCMICIVKLKKKILPFKLHIDVNQSALHQYLIYFIFFRLAKFHDKLIQFSHFHVWNVQKGGHFWRSCNWKNHPLSLVLFSKTIKEEIKIEDNFACPDFYVQYAVWTLPLKIMFIQVDESKWVKELFLSSKLCGSNIERLWLCQY